MSQRAVKYPGRKRRIGGWLLLVLTVIVAAQWVWSGWWWVEFTGWGWDIKCGSGELIVSKEPALVIQHPRYWYSGMMGNRWPGYVWTVQSYWKEHTRSSGGWNGGVICMRPVGGKNEYAAAFWPVPLMMGGGVFLLLRSARKARKRASERRCGACGYDMRGLAEGAVCPECGT